jgi:hypothetical protein
MIDKKTIRYGVFPLLITSLFHETASNHHPQPHSNRSERMEQLTRRTQENNVRASFVMAQRGTGGGNAPDPIPAEEVLTRETRARRSSEPKSDI